MAFNLINYITIYFNYIILISNNIKFKFLKMKLVIVHLLFILKISLQKKFVCKMVLFFGKYLFTKLSERTNLLFFKILFLNLRLYNFKSFGYGLLRKS